MSICVSSRRNSFARTATESLIKKSEIEQKSNDESADVWTNFGTLGDVFGSTFINFYWGTSMADSVSALVWTETPPCLYWGFGMTLSFVALASCYAYRKLNLYHQETGSRQSVRSQSPIGQDCQSDGSLSDLESQNSINQLVEPNKESSHHFDEVSKEYIGWNRSLSFGQNLVIKSVHLCSIGNFCGTFSFAAQQLSPNYDEVSGEAKVTIQAVGLVFGFLCTVAEVRNFVSIMLEENMSSRFD